MGTDTSRRRLETNAFSLLLSRVLAAVATTAIFSIAAHQLTVRDFGLVASTLAGGFLANSLVTFGTDTLITRDVAARGQDAMATARAALRLQFVGASLLLFAAVGAWAFGAPAVLVVQAAALVPQAVVTIAGAVLRGRQHMVPLATSSIVAAAVSLSATIAGFAITTNPLVPVTALALGAVAAAIMLWIAAERSGSIRRSEATTSSADLAPLLRRTAPFAAMVVLAAAGAQGGLLLVEFMTNEPTGGYGAAIRLTEAGRLVPAAVIGAFFPAMVGGAHYTPRYRQWIRVLVVYSVAAITALVATAELINRVFFDSQPDGAALIRIIALSLIFTLWRLTLSFEAIAEGDERRVVIGALVGTLVLVIAGIALAGPWGARGVAAAQVAGIAAAGAYLSITRRSTAKTPPSTAPIGMGKPVPGHG